MASELKDKYIGRYRIDELLGSGAMAHVYKAFDSEINRTVAIKVLKKNNCHDEEYFNRFLSEAKAAGFLSHPNIVTIFDVGRYEETPYIVMELIEGLTLGEKLESGELFDIKYSLKIMLQLAEALDYAHNNGIVHRDVKPENVLFMPDGETVKLADFGIAHRDDTDSSEKTKVGTLLGTPRYMSPEQALGEAIDGRSDLFSLGVVFYEMLTGEKAFKSQSVITLMVQISQEQPELMGHLSKDIPSGVQHILNRLLEKKPNDRPSSGAELASTMRWELDALNEEKHKYMPLYIKWTLIMGSVVAMVLGICMFVVLRIQSEALTEHAVDSGMSLAQFIATESSIPVLGEDWISLESLVKDTSDRKTFEYLIVQDHSGIVRGAMDTSLLGKPLPVAENSQMIQQQGGTRVTSLALEGGQRVFNFDTPILFRDTEVGRIQLGLLQDNLDRIKQVATGLLLAVGAVTLLSVVVVLFIFGRLIAQQLKTLRRAMVDFTAGGLDRRISNQRNDEIGDLFRLFNDMADKVQNKLKPINEDDLPTVKHVETEVKPDVEYASQGDVQPLSEQDASVDDNDKTRIAKG
ncbi:serine/threonine-protein kinase [Neptunomonas sp.]|uniref:serine/threonine protein kinase n=1 Tax=Neptunomonas sp. TaxID=1971898 RepID=UPI0025DF82E6|nr:serine/threonine-protein kinase [Neptunomonas sp.]